MKLEKPKKACFIISIFSLIFTFFTCFDLEKVETVLKRLAGTEKLGFFIGYFFLQTLFIGIGFYLNKKTKKKENTFYTKASFYLLLLSTCMTLGQILFLLIK